MNIINELTFIYLTEQRCFWFQIKKFTMHMYSICTLAAFREDIQSTWDISASCKSLVNYGILVQKMACPVTNRAPLQGRQPYVQLDAYRIVSKCWFVLQKCPYVVQTFQSYRPRCIFLLLHQILRQFQGNCDIQMSRPNNTRLL